MTPGRLAAWITASWLVAVSAPVADAAPGASPGAFREAGAAAFARLGCGGCHAVTRPKTDMTLAERVARKGPDLWFAGSKLRPEWLAGWLAAPEPLLGIRYDRLAPEPGPEPHPAVPQADVPALVAYLTSLRDPEMRTGVIPAEKPPPTVMLQGRILFGKEQQCYACHKTQTRYGALVGGVTAPSLVDAGRRLNPDWVYAFLTDPRRYVPVPRMPIYSGTTFPGYSPEQLVDLTRYLAQMEPRAER